MIQINNRLPDLKKKTQKDASATNLNEEFPDLEEVEEELSTKPHNTAVRKLLNKYLNINDQLFAIEENLLQMKIMVTAKYSNQFDQKEFDKLRRHSLQISNIVIKKFKKRESKLPEAADFSALARMKRLLYYGFFYKYVNLWTKNEEFFLEYEESMKKKLKMQSQILNCNLSDEEIETLIDNKNTNLFMSNILQDTEAERKTLHELKDRFEDLKKLEKSITEVHNLFISLQTSVAKQGEVLQRIETHFDATRNFVEQAAEIIEEANQLKRKRCCRFLCCRYLC